jgi:hypothetical protein
LLAILELAAIRWKSMITGPFTMLNNSRVEARCLYFDIWRISDKRTSKRRVFCLRALLLNVTENEWIVLRVLATTRVKRFTITWQVDDDGRRHLSLAGKVLQRIMPAVFN